MPGQLLPLRLFHAAALSRTVFHHHLFLSAGSQVSAVRLFSSRAAARSVNRESFSSPRVSTSKGSASKSLIEDEAELSDWVSDLRTDSLRFSTDDEDGDDANVDHRGSSVITRTARDPMKRQREENRSVSRKPRLDGSRNFRDGPFDRSRPEKSKRQRDSGLDSRKSQLDSKNRFGRRFDEEDGDEDKRDELFSRKSTRSSLARNSKKDFGRNNLQGRSPRRSILEVSEDEEGFDKDEDEDEEDEDDLFGNKVEMKRGTETRNKFEEDRADVLNGRDGVQPVAVGSRRQDDSYLSRTRLVV